METLDDPGIGVSAALAYLDGRIEIQGDIFAALRGLIERPRGGLRQWLATALARSWRLWPESWHQSRARARRNILFHYGCATPTGQLDRVSFFVPLF